MTRRQSEIYKDVLQLTARTDIGYGDWDVGLPDRIKHEIDGFANSIIYLDVNFPLIYILDLLVGMDISRDPFLLSKRGVKEGISAFSPSSLSWSPER